MEGAAFATRASLVAADLLEALRDVYAERTDVDVLAEQLLGDALAAAAARPESLRVLDRCREVDPSWFLSQDVVGYTCYADRFAGGLRGVRRHLGYLVELGVRYLHLMPLLRPREGENDGGYAVADYDAVDPRLGDLADLEDLAGDMHDRGMALCIDLVLNHTAREHEWARRALAGDPAYRDFYLFFPDRALPDAYERTLPEVFPDMAPGSFTQLTETGEWVWTTFHEFQWDLDWSNPEVFRAMLGVLYRLANRGVDVVRLDAAPFLWKRLGTSCQNQPEAHRILQALRALVRVAMPGVALKAEAIVGPDELVPYLGGHHLLRSECDLAYDNQLMVMLWSSLATRDARLATRALARRPRPPAGTGWVSYLRCHDDIGWAVSDRDATDEGLDPFLHRQFLAAFYSGRHDGSFARGADFQVNPLTGDVRTSGSAASLAGLEAALEGDDREEVDVALRRLETLHAVVYSFGGLPLLYMGDELATRNDRAWAADPAHADDNRWLHRPRMDWDAARRRDAPEALEARMFASLRRLGGARRRTESLRADAETRVLWPEGPRVLAYVRRHPRAEPVLCLACFSDDEQYVDAGTLAHAGVTRGQSPRLLHGSREDLRWEGDCLVLGAWEFAWLTPS
jgi:amylosucrase